MQMMDLEYNGFKACQRLHRINASKAALNLLLAAFAQVFTRLYTLRNQIIHGGAIYNSQVKREQFKVACNLLKKLIRPDYCANDECAGSALGGGVLSGFNLISKLST